MDYLTYEEYQSITSNPVSLENFPKQLAAASFTLDGATVTVYSSQACYIQSDAPTIPGVPLGHVVFKLKLLYFFNLFHIYIVFFC